MKETGVVVKVESGQMTVRFSRTEACKKCGGCSQGEDGSMITVVRNEIGAKVGDWVALELAEGSLLLASLLAYGLPLVGLVGGLLLGTALAPRWPQMDPNALPLGCAAVLTMLAYMVNHITEPLRRKSGRFSPHAVLVRAAENQSSGSVQ